MDKLGDKMIDTGQFIVDDIECTLVQWQTPGAPTYIKTVTLSRCGQGTVSEFPSPMIMQMKIVGPSLDQFKKGSLVSVSFDGSKLHVE